MHGAFLKTRWRTPDAVGGEDGRPQGIQRTTALPRHNMVPHSRAESGVVPITRRLLCGLCPRRVMPAPLSRAKEATQWVKS